MIIWEKCKGNMKKLINNFSYWYRTPRIYTSYAHLINETLEHENQKILL